MMFESESGPTVVVNVTDQTYYFAIFFPAVYIFVVVFCIAFWDEALSKTWEEIAVGNNSILEHDFERSREADDALNWYARAFFKIYTMNRNDYFLSFELNSNLKKIFIIILFSKVFPSILSKCQKQCRM